MAEENPTAGLVWTISLTQSDGETPEVGPLTGNRPLQYEAAHAGDLWPPQHLTQVSPNSAKRPIFGSIRGSVGLVIR